jgi:hypothetical protein
MKGLELYLILWLTANLVGVAQVNRQHAKMNVIQYMMKD